MDELETEEETQATKRRSKSHKKRVDSYAYTPLSKPGPDKHLRGYLVTIEALTDHKGVEYHHEGEEFVFVLKGGITIQVGENVSKLGQGGEPPFQFRPPSQIEQSQSGDGKTAGRRLRALRRMRCRFN